MAKRAKAKRADSKRRHELFVREYVTDYNGTRAYQAAFPGCKSKAAAAVEASKLLRLPSIRERVDALEAAAVEDLAIRKHRTLREAARLAFSDPVGLMGDGGTILDLNDMDADARAMVASIEVFEEYQGKGAAREYIGRTKKVKLWDKNAALEKLFKHQGLFKADNDQRASVISQFMEAVSGKSRGLPGRHQPKGA